MESEPKPSTNHLEDLQKDLLYARAFKSDITSRATLSPDTPTAIPEDTTWKHDSSSKLPLEPLTPEQQQKKRARYKKILMGAVLFFVLSATAAGFIIVRGLNVISDTKIDIAFSGPVSIAAGEKLNFGIAIKNENRTPITNARIYIDYPDGTKAAADISADLLHETQEIGDIAAHGETARTASAILFGKLASTKDIKVTLEYGVKASNAVYKKEKTYPVAINSTPLTMSIDHSPQTVSGQDLPFTITIASNSNVPLANLILTADYPLGYTVTDTSPVTVDRSIFQIPILKPGETKIITIHGTAQGDENDEKIFRFDIGAADSNNEKIVSTSYLASSESVIVRRPALAAKILIGDISDQSAVLEPRQAANAKIELTNNTTSQFSDIEASLSFSGNALDELSIQGANGLYRLPTKTITWDKTTASQLALLGPGQKAVLGFSFASRSAQELAAIKNGSVSMAFSASGKILNSEQTVRASGTSITKIQPSISLIPRLVYSTGPFKNTGPIPPKAETATTYTVLWTVTRSSNDITGAEVRGTLPSYVKWLNVIQPSAENISYDANTHEVVWRIENIPAGRVGQSAKEVAFQVQFTPSFSQIRETPLIVDAISFKGTDSFTNRAINLSGYSLTSYLATDPQNQSGEVVQ